MFMTLAQNPPPFPTFWGVFPGDGGRYFPLGHLDIILIANILQDLNALNYTSLAHAIYAMNIIEFAIVVCAFFYTIARISTCTWYAFIALFVTLFSTPFVTSFIGLCFPERLQSVCITLFLLFSTLFFYYKGRPNSSTLAWVYLVLGVLFGNLALYYKEPTLAIIGASGGFYLLFSYLNYLRGVGRVGESGFVASLSTSELADQSKVAQSNSHSTKTYAAFGLDIKSIIFASLLALGALAFLVQYYFIIFVITPRGGQVINDYLVGVIHYLLNDPIPSGILGLLLLSRAYMLIVKKDAFHPFSDALIIGGFVYLLGLVALHVHSGYHAMPLYYVALFALGAEAGLLKARLFKALLAIIFVVYAISSLPLSLFRLSEFVGFSRVSHNSFVFLKGYIEKNASRYKDHRITLYLEGRPRSNNVNDINTFPHQALNEQYGLSSELFDMNSMYANGSTVHGIKDKNSPFSIFNTTEIGVPKSGDLIILTPFSLKYESKATLAAMEKRYRLIYHENYLYIPNLGIKALLKLAYVKKNHLEGTFSPSGMSYNTFAYPGGIYIFEVK